ncbi:MAG TPA: hypothetical protein VEX35_05920 [Allosphingosinicella sp.]|nr:hypothetical protein [Allosphingosinicella sp.]
MNAVRPRQIVLAAIIALPALPAAAGAEPEIGSRLESGPRGAVTPQEREDQATARRVMRTYAACLLDNRPRTAEAIVAAPYGGEEQAAIVRRRVQGAEDCMGRTGLSMRFPTESLAGAIGEAGIRARFSTADLAPVAALADEDVARLGLGPRNGYEDIAACIARRDPHAVRALVLTEPATAEERTARRPVMTQVGACVNQGQSLRVDQVGLRAMVAVALYRLLDGLSPPPGRRRN